MGCRLLNYRYFDHLFYLWPFVYIRLLRMFHNLLDFKKITDNIRIMLFLQNVSEINNSAPLWFVSVMNVTMLFWFVQGLVHIIITILKINKDMNTLSNKKCHQQICDIVYSYNSMNIHIVDWKTKCYKFAVRTNKHVTELIKVNSKSYHKKTQNNITMIFWKKIC